MSSYWSVILIFLYFHTSHQQPFSPNPEEQEKLKKLPPDRVGANFDHSSHTDPNWLPSFGRVWNNGRRWQSRLGNRYCSSCVLLSKMAIAPMICISSLAGISSMRRKERLGDGRGRVALGGKVERGQGSWTTLSVTRSCLVNVCICQWLKTV